jgi:mono/diheme cytochrome c family protein
MEFRILKWVKLSEFVTVLLTIAAAAFAADAAHAAPQNAGSAAATGAASYAKNCALCHGDQRQGHPPAYPSLVGVGSKMTGADIAKRIRTGATGMPPFPALPDDEVQALVSYLTAAGSSTAAPAVAAQAAPEASSPAVQAGDALFHQNCAFCHGRDAMGGESGPDLTRSKLVLSDKTGEKIAEVVREGRPGTKMPGFNFSAAEIQSLIEFLRARVAASASMQGQRRGVEVSDLQTGNAEAGKAYFNGPGGCSRCHSPTGDLAGIATRYEGLRLEERMLYPRGAKGTVTVTLPSGEKITGTLAYRDEFVIGLRDSNGIYRSWKTSRVQFTVDSPANAHVDLFSKYTDDDIHNLMAYLQTLR